MAKRFTDTDKWKKMWFRKLKNDHKVFWMYILDQCDHAGIWEVDFELAHYFCNGIDEIEIRSIFQKQYQEFDSGKRWFISDFITFQYGKLNENVNAHKSVIQRLERYNLSTLDQPLINPSLRVKDKDKVKDKDNKVISEEFLIELETAHTNINVRVELDKFRDYLKSKGKRYKDYRAAFRNWLRSDYVPKIEPNADHRVAKQIKKQEVYVQKLEQEANEDYATADDIKKIMRWKSA